MKEKPPENLSAILIGIVIAVYIAPFLVGAALLIFEYAAVQPIAQNPDRPLFWVTIGLYMGLYLNFRKLFSIRFYKDQYVREKYAFYVVFVLFLLILMIFFVVMSGYLPWNIPILLLHLIRGETIQRLSPHWAEQALIVGIGVAAIYLLVQSHKNWQGAKSFEQVRREENNQPFVLMTEAYSELQRLVCREKPFAIHHEQEIDWLTDTPEEPIEPLTWHQQARELLSLVSATYAFRHVSPARSGDNQNELIQDDWHDLKECWN